MSRTDRPAGFQGYHRQSQGTEDMELTHVAPGTPCGEYMRRYWQPVAMSSELGELPLPLRILGEDLVLFRDKSGQVGLLHKHCAHRGASLEYGIPAEHGIICCYHGWHFDIDGTIIKAGSEPPDSPISRNVVQGAYPVEERNGLLFAYLGPPGERPAVPVYDTEFMPDVTSKPFSITTPCNWLQIYENTQDPIHVLHLHARSSGVQFGAASGVDQLIDYQPTPLGMINIQIRHVGAHLWTGTTGDFNPMSFKEPETKAYKGHQIDTAKQLAKDMGVEVEFVPTDWKTLINGVVAGKYDVVMTGTSMTVSRAKAAGYTIPWGRTGYLPLTRKEHEGKFKSWADLNNPNVTIGYNLGTSFADFVKLRLPNAKVKEVESPARDWQELLAGRVDVTISSILEAGKLSSTHGNLIIPFQKTANSLPLSFITPQNDQVWLNFLNNWMRIKIEAGFFKSLNAKWGIQGQD